MTHPGYKERGSGPAVVFLHGIGGNRHAFDLQLEAMAPRFRCIAWDMPGYGGSAPAPELTFDGLAEALVRLLDHLGVEQAHVVGHSMGGMVAQRFAVKHPPRLRRLVLAQTSARFGPPGGRWQQEFLAARLKPLDEGHTPADIAGSLIRSLVADPRDDAAVDRAVATMSPLPADVYRQALGCLVGFAAEDALTDITRPTLCLAGEHDRTAPPEVVRRLAEGIPGARFECLPGAGHLAYVETPDRFTAAVSSFLETRDGEC